jgi:hypothetical protein
MNADARKPNPPANWPERFLKAFAKSGNITQAAKAARVTRQSVYLHRQADPAFETAFLDAQEEATDLLELEARRRAETGTLKPVYQQGEEVGKVREFSDTLLLKANRPDKFKDRAELQHGGRVEYAHSLPGDLGALSLEEELALRDIARKLADPGKPEDAGGPEVPGAVAEPGPGGGGAGA